MIMPLDQSERLDHYMARANAAYYATRDPYADFTTAPEISQVVGELLGAWSAVVWQSMGRPPGVILAEAGPGRGTLMIDALRAIGRVAPDFRAALTVHLVETSPALRAIQASRIDAVWHHRVETIPEAPMILLANEFLDALPIRQFIQRGDGHDTWDELYVALGHWREMPTDRVFPIDPEGSLREICEPAQALARHLAARFEKTPGAALFLDYGPAVSGLGHSLQALRHGKPCDPLVDSGTADLTAHVDFAAFAEAAAGLAVHGPIPQGMFLARLGLFQRTAILAGTLQPQAASHMLDGARRLAEPDGMGRLFKAMALCHPALAAPPGFSE